ncbi:MAG: hypothetical protein LBV28_03930 [Puniceicoccales bacterium]|nr:hypothetical protein [Puniceicoccales bacterium]
MKNYLIGAVAALIGHFSAKMSQWDKRNGAGRAIGAVAKTIFPSAPDFAVPV